MRHGGSRPVLERVPRAEAESPPRTLGIDLPEVRSQHVVDAPPVLHVVAHQLEQAHPPEASCPEIFEIETGQSPIAIEQIEEVEDIRRELERLSMRRGTADGTIADAKNPDSTEVLPGEKLPESGRPDSNRRRPAWEAGILPLNYARGSGGN